MPSDIKFYGYIQGFSSSSEAPNIGAKCESLPNEIILYGRRGQNLIFYFMSENVIKDFVVNFFDVEGQFSCKLIKDNVYVCACTESHQITLKILAHIYVEENKEGLILKESINVPNFNNHEDAILYTTEFFYKILCAREINNNTIECQPFYIEAEYSLNLSHTKIRFVEMIGEYMAFFSYYYDFGNQTIFNSEYIQCYTQINKIGIYCGRF